METMRKRKRITSIGNETMCSNGILDTDNWCQCQQALLTVDSSFNGSDQNLQHLTSRHLMFSRSSRGYLGHVLKTNLGRDREYATTVGGHYRSICTQWPLPNEVTWWRQSQGHMMMSRSHSNHVNNLAASIKVNKQNGCPYKQNGYLYKGKQNGCSL